jgi:hypothetical protein
MKMLSLMFIVKRASKGLRPRAESYRLGCYALQYATPDE